MLETRAIEKEAKSFSARVFRWTTSRVGIARALAVNPTFIVCDEALSALVVSIQAQVINLILELQEILKLTYLFIAHDLNMVRHISDDTAVMYLGKVVEKAETSELFETPKHPYTIGLLAAAPEADPDFEQSRAKTLMSGEVASPINPEPICRFAGRCPYARPKCKQNEPELMDVGNNHYVACYKVQGGLVMNGEVMKIENKIRQLGYTLPQSSQQVLYIRQLEELETHFMFQVRYLGLMDK